MNKITVAAIVAVACAFGIYLQVRDSNYTLLDFLASVAFFAAGVIAARFRIWAP